MEWPPASPDLNPVDFYLWAEMERRVSVIEVLAWEYTDVLRCTDAVYLAMTLRV
jgi:hypothetical protein